MARNTELAAGQNVVLLEEQFPSNVYVWMRRFNSEEERQQLYEAVYESEEWKSTIGPRVGELIDRSAIQVTRIIPTPHSVTQ